MRPTVPTVEQMSIADGDAIAALSRILCEMNGPKSVQGWSDQAEQVGYQIEANAILDQLAATGFIVSHRREVAQLGLKARDASRTYGSSF